MLIFDRENWPYHRKWCGFVLIATAASALWYVDYGRAWGTWNWPSGSSPPGFVFGVAGGAIILFEMLLWPRKSLWRGWRIGRTKLWMTAHIWLGLLSLPLLFLHGSFHFSLNTSTLSAVLMWLLLFVVFSGIFGVVVQTVVPRLMLDKVPAETITSQIPHVLAQYRTEAARLIRATCAPSSPLGASLADLSKTNSTTEAAFLSVGTLRQVGRVQGKVLQVGVTAEYLGECEPLVAFFRDQVDPYLAAKRGTALPLSSQKRAVILFQALEDNIRAEFHPVVDHLASLCDQRRQFDLQARLHKWLYVWLGIHVSLSVALVVLMLAHIFLSLKYL